MRKIVLAVCMLLIATVARGAIIYLPIQYQYGIQDKFYYGGSDRAVIARGLAAEQMIDHANSRGVSNRPTRVYSDLMPYQSNAAIYGFTANNARMEAEASMPRYFRMVDVRASGQMQRDGTILIPATAPGSIEIRPYVRPTAIAPRPVLVIPKAIRVQPAQPVATVVR